MTEDLSEIFISGVAANLQLSPEVNHIIQHFSSFPDGMVVMFRKKMRDDMGAGKAASLIEGDSQRAVPCACLQKGILSSVSLNNKINHGFPVAVALAVRGGGDIFYLQYAVALIGNNAYRLYPAVIQHVEGALFKIAVYHIFLLIA